MTPIRVTAALGTAGVLLPHGAPQLDSLLAYAIVLRDGMDPRGIEPIEVPLARDGSDDLYLCSVGQYEVDARSLQFTNRKFPIPEAQCFAEEKMRRINISAGAEKSYRLPREVMFLKGDQITWWAQGDASQVRELLKWIEYIGKRRAVGLGRVLTWFVNELEEVWPGFPVLHEGRPLRPLPLNYAGVSDDSTLAMAVLSDPKKGVTRWHHHLQERVWVP